MKLNTKILVLITFLKCALILGQELPPIQNFTPKEYKAQNQNWAISQSTDKTIYIANNQGLLEYNGADWKLYPTPNETILRSVKVVNDKIFTGCFMDFGYWKKDQFNILKYTSITKELGIEIIEDEQFWDIININNWVFFRSLNRIYLYNITTNSIKIIESESIISAMYKVGNEIYFQRLGEGIFKIANGGDKLINGNLILKNNTVINIFKKNENLLIQTRNRGFYLLADNKLNKWKIEIDKHLSNLSIYKSIQLKNGDFILGTISNGIIQIDADGNLKLEINKIKGLNNNTVLSLFEDDESNIWLGLDNGISTINLESPFKIYYDEYGFLGSVYSSIVYKDTIYLGTNHGLFYKSLYSNENYTFIPGTNGQVWCLKEVNGDLLCGHDSGTFLIDNGEATKISNIQGVWSFRTIGNNENLLMQGNYDGLYILEKKNNIWKVRNKIKGFNISSKDFEFITDSEIFVNHEYSGIYRIKVDSNFTKVIDKKIDTLMKGANSGLLKFDNQILYSYKKGVYKYSVSDAIFKKDSLYSRLYNESDFTSGILVKNNNDNYLWNFSNSSINYINKSNFNRNLKINNIPLKQSIRQSIVGYENVLFLNNQNFLIGTATGYIIINLNKLEVDDFNVKIDQIYKSENNIFTNKSAINAYKKGYLDISENNLEISFYSPNFNKYLEVQYQYKLQGIYNNWSNWSASSKENFKNLSHGNYTFIARAKVGNKISKNIDSYKFEIAKPWYITNVFIFIYFLSFILCFYTIHRLYKRYFNKQKAILLLRKEREYQLFKAENEKEIVKMRNEKLREDNLNKNRELATSTMNIIKKNELLKTIKSELNNINNKKLINPVIKIINNNLNQNDDWVLFHEAFNRVDKDFLNKVKKKHPNLSPNDLRLCAYLRLNLSSKEIAPLLNISYKSVEIKRYRLRKKINLSQKENLTKYILNI